MERSVTPGVSEETGPSPRGGRQLRAEQLVPFALSGASRAQVFLLSLSWGSASAPPQALCFHPLRGFDVAGDRVFAAGGRVFAAGDRVFGAGDRVFAAGDRVFGAGDRVFAAGGRVVAAGDRVFAAGGRVVAAGDRVVAAGDRVSRRTPRVSIPQK